MGLVRHAIPVVAGDSERCCVAPQSKTAQRLFLDFALRGCPALSFFGGINSPDRMKTFTPLYGRQNGYRRRAGYLETVGKDWPFST
jgi:hypothetical protein